MFGEIVFVTVPLRLL